ncbi:MAG: helix-turn-helix transcriptional regulator [Polaromonas sp.]
MSTFSTSLSSEIARVAKKELKSELQALREASTAQRREIALLKKQIKALATLVKSSQKTVKKPKDEATTDSPTQKRQRTIFGPTALVAYREQMGFTKGQMAQLLDASPLSVYKWETGKAQPRMAQLQKIANVIKLGKRAALAQLQTNASSQPVGM